MPPSDTEGRPDKLDELISEQSTQSHGAAVAIRLESATTPGGEASCEIEGLQHYKDQVALADRLLADFQENNPSCAQALVSSVDENIAIVLNFHGVAPQEVGAMRKGLERLALVHERTQLLPATRGRNVPAAVACFYDGFRETGLRGAEICHDLGIPALFFPIFEPDQPGSATLTDVDLKNIAAIHELCFHTRSHKAASEIDSERLLTTEVYEVFARLTELSGRAPRYGAFLGGAKFNGARLADRKLLELGMNYHVSNWSIQQLSDLR